MDINRQQIMKTFIRIIDHISDKDYQKRVWIKGVGPEVDDFDETVCHFFQEGNGIIEKYKDFELTDHQNQLLRNFLDQFKIFSNENDLPEEFIDTLEWTKITELAAELIKAFKNH
jgi:hypothetical protein